MKIGIARLVICIFFISCQNPEKKKIIQLVHNWENREILYPADTSFISYGQSYTQKVDMHYDNFAFVVYVDSTGCMSCKLQLPKWAEFIETIDSVSGNQIPCLFFFHSREKESLIKFLKRTHFSYPVYIDENDSFNKLNHFPKEIEYQTFLVDKASKVLAIGNPVYNPRLKELYLNIIQGKQMEREKGRDRPETEVNINRLCVSLGDFEWDKVQKTTFVLTNIGVNPLIIENVVTSCGCISVDYKKEPVRSKENICLDVIYKADHPEYFNKTITVYCNTDSSPLKLTVSGNAK